MRHGTASDHASIHAPQPTDGLGTRLLGARIEDIARIAALLHDRTASQDARAVPARVVRHLGPRPVGASPR